MPITMATEADHALVRTARAAQMARPTMMLQNRNAGSESCRLPLEMATAAMAAHTPPAVPAERSISPSRRTKTSPRPMTAM